jgi:hypothetical protein
MSLFFQLSARSQHVCRRVPREILGCTKKDGNELRQELVSGNLDPPDSWWFDSARHREYAEERLKELEPVAKARGHHEDAGSSHSEGSGSSDACAHRTSRSTPPAPANSCSLRYGISIRRLIEIGMLPYNMF